MSKVPITLVGAQSLRDELKELKTVVRPRIVKAIAEARAHGDLKENAEYHAAREQQSFAEGRLNEIEGKLSNAVVIDVTTLDAKGRVVFGATVEMLDENTGKEVCYKIVGEDEADIKKNMISVGSPIARAMIGKEEGDIAEVNAPGGVIEYEIISVKYI